MSPTKKTGLTQQFNQRWAKTSNRCGLYNDDIIITITTITIIVVMYIYNVARWIKPVGSWVLRKRVCQRETLWFRWWNIPFTQWLILEGIQNSSKPYPKGLWALRPYHNNKVLSRSFQTVPKKRTEKGVETWRNDRFFSIVPTLMDPHGITTISTSRKKQYARGFHWVSQRVSWKIL